MTTFLAVAVVVLDGCAPPDTTGIKLIGHGGLGPEGMHPMNSEAALLGALDLGLEGIELDVQLTKDSVLVAHHGMVVDGPACKGRVNDLTWAELKSCAAAQGPGDLFRGVRVDDLVRKALHRHPHAEFTFDVKVNSGMEWWAYLHTFCRAIARLHADTGTRLDVRVECMTPDLLRAMAESAPQVPTFLYTDDPDADLTKARELGCTGVTMHIDDLHGEDAERIRAANLQLTVFGVGSDLALYRAVKLAPQRIQVDQ